MVRAREWRGMKGGQILWSRQGDVRTCVMLKWTDKKYGVLLNKHHIMWSREQGAHTFVLNRQRVLMSCQSNAETNKMLEWNFLKREALLNLTKQASLREAVYSRRWIQQADLGNEKRDNSQVISHVVVNSCLPLVLSVLSPAITKGALICIQLIKPIGWLGIKSHSIVRLTYLALWHGLMSRCKELKFRTFRHS